MYYENFERLCVLNNVRPGTVSKATGISTATLTSWKQGKYTPKQDKLQLIADYFGVSIDYLMTGEDKSDLSDNKYYINEETAEMADKIFHNKEYQNLQSNVFQFRCKSQYNMHQILLFLKKGGERYSE